MKYSHKCPKCGKNHWCKQVDHDWKHWVECKENMVHAATTVSENGKVFEREVN